MPKANTRKGLRFSIRLTVLCVFVIATTLTAAIAIGLQFYFSRSMAIQSALSRCQNAAEETGNYLKSIDSSAFQAVRMLSRHPDLTRGGWVNPGTLPLFSDVLKNNRIFYAIYIGFANGNFFEVVNLDSSPIARRQLKAAPQDRWAVVSVRGSGDARRRRFQYYDAGLRMRDFRAEESAYDPRVRPWYIHAKKERVFKTDPYLFQHLQAPGQSYSIRLPETGADAGAVLTVDIALDSLSGFLKTQDLGNRAEVYSYQDGGELIASNQSENGPQYLPNTPALELDGRQKAFISGAGRVRVSNELDWPPIDYAVSGRPQGYSVDLMRMISRMTGLKIEFVNGYTWEELLDLFKKTEIDILQPVFRSRSNEAMGILSKPILNLSYAALTRPGAPEIHHINQLTGKTIAIPAGWSIIPLIREQLPGISILQVRSPREAITSVVENKAYASLDAAIILHYTADYFFIEDVLFHENVNMRAGGLPKDLHLLVQKNAGLLAEILDKAIERLREEGLLGQLEEKWCNAPDASVGYRRQTTVPYAALVAMAKNPQLMDHLSSAVIGGKPMFVYVTRLHQERASAEYFAVAIPKKALIGPSMKRVWISILITSLCMLVALPLTWLFAAPIVRPIKRLALENEKIKQRRYEDVDLYDSVIEEIYDLSTSIVEMAATIKQHEEELKELMDSLIRLIARAIDDKSPFTAGHCARVPELASMLADAATRTSEKPFDRFGFAGREEYREFRMAAWLHDCGKITTPEHIVNKGAKLETLYNRIHEIRTRFEVLWRDAEIDYLKQVADRPGDEPRLRQALEGKRSQLQSDFEFIANANIGGEHMTRAQLERLQMLAMTTWQRHFDDRQGLSPVEAVRYPAVKPALPAREPLLADKPQHLIERTRSRDYDKHLGIRMEIPEHLYNLGELYNLSVERGTLTREDRFKIKEHIISTIKMLESLPFPEELARVPRYASTHHETLKGDGYPRGLSAAQLSMPERIIALADIFEALTASDRPYKKAKTLSEAVSMLSAMAEEGHIDRDVFELFLTSGVYLEYGRRFLDPGQLDEVHVARYLRRSGAVHPGNEY